MKQGQKSIPGRGKEQVPHSLVEEMMGTGTGRRTSMAPAKKARGNAAHSEAEGPKDERCH